MKKRVQTAINRASTIIPPMPLDVHFHPEKIDVSAFIAPGAVVLGDVTIGAESSVWFGSVIRGDCERIVIGCQSNVQDLSIIHADPSLPCLIGDRVTLGHAAIVHGAIVEDDAMIGIRATVLNGARIGSGSIIAAGAVVPEGMIIPPNSLVMGVPAKIRGESSDEHRQRIRYAAEHYVAAAREFTLAQRASEGGAVVRGAPAASVQSPREP
jgi:carbonic anhydrase/acetyltransferase-like protein (isoleucine patch superfamily)